jgi:hypothetical protein
MENASEINLRGLKKIFFSENPYEFFKHLRLRMLNFAPKCLKFKTRRKK